MSISSAVAAAASFAKAMPKKTSMITLKRETIRHNFAMAVLLSSIVKYPLTLPLFLNSDIIPGICHPQEITSAEDVDCSII
jgi:precorrin-4 methylase